MLTMQQIEESIADLSDRLEQATYDFADVARRAATAEAEYRGAKARAAVTIISTNGTMPANQREARVEHSVTDERTAHLLAAAEKEAMREALITFRTRLESLRTLAATARYQTSH